MKALDRAPLARALALSLCGALASTVLLPSAAQAAPRKSAKGVVSKAFGSVDGQAVSLYTLTNARGAQAKITNYGGIITELHVPDRRGRLGDVVLGYDNVAGYVKSSPYFGCIVGRYGNRIAKGQFTLDGSTYNLAKNNGENHLHGGVKAFDKRIWRATPLRSKNAVGLALRYFSPSGEEGYPGNVNTRVEYWLTDANELKIVYRAITDKATPLNLTHHSYFNLAGAGSGDILKHRVRINANRFTPVDGTLIPTGELRPVAGTPLDFRNYHAVGERINQDDEQLKFGKGYDHNWVLNRAGKNKHTWSLAANVYEPTSGRTMAVYTTEPGIQFYTGNFLDGTITGKGGSVYKLRNGFCLETQHFPDSPNKPSFPSTILRPGQTYTQTTIYAFGAR